LLVDNKKDSISSGPSTSRGVDSQNCVFCNGRAGLLSKDDLLAYLTDKGLKSIIDVCAIRNDEPSKIILKKKYKSPSDFPWKFHKLCRRDFINPAKIATVKKRLLEEGSMGIHQVPFYPQKSAAQRMFFSGTITALFAGKWKTARKKEGNFHLWT
jgi:hypothetical protein